jgi:hypothetical protein
MITSLSIEMLGATKTATTNNNNNNFSPEKLPSFFSNKFFIQSRIFLHRDIYLYLRFECTLLFRKNGTMCKNKNGECGKKNYTQRTNEVGTKNGKTLLQVVDLYGIYLFNALLQLELQVLPFLGSVLVYNSVVAPLLIQGWCKRIKQ